MTSYSAMADRGREEARARTAGRRKVIAERIEYREVQQKPGNVTALPGGTVPQSAWVEASLIGSCGHTLRRLARCPMIGGVPSPGYYLTAKVGRRMTCEHDACRIPEHVYTDADCEYVMGIEVERRCTTRAAWDTGMGRVCTRHRNHYARESYIDSPGTPIPKD